MIVFRTCKLSNSIFTMASVDILYIDITRRWSGALPDSREAGNTPMHTNKISTVKQDVEVRESGILETEPVMCSEVIACHSLSDSLWHRATIIEMRWDHNVTVKRGSGMNYSDIAPCEECLWGEADGWRSHGPGWKGLYRGDCGLNLEWAHTYSGRLESEFVIPANVHWRIC